MECSDKDFSCDVKVKLLIVVSCNFGLCLYWEISLWGEVLVFFILKRFFVIGKMIFLYLKRKV